ncbi:MAG: hypothetical protein JW966_10645 [Anaerolineae bacterium]|nr:hypothetical protein [Anaerolineae bacterium]
MSNIVSVIVSGVSLFIAFVTLVMVVVIPYLQDRQMRKEQRRIWMRDFLHGKLNDLIKLRAKLQFLQNKGFVSDPSSLPDEKRAQILQWEKEREVAYGKAFAIMLTIPRAKVRGKAGQVMDQVENWDKNKKLEAINAAISELGDLLDLAMGEDVRISRLR